VSYDLYMLAPENGVDPMDQLERLAEERRSEPKGEARMRHLADALCPGILVTTGGTWSSREPPRSS
jgi:hypothetical protein